MSEQDRPPMELWSDSELLRAAHAGNTTAFKVFVARCIPHLWRFLRWLCPQFGIPKGQAKDFAQEAALRALTQVRAHERGHIPLPEVTVDWLFAIAHNLVVDDYRKRRRGLLAQAKLAEIVRAKAPSREELEQFAEVRELLNLMNDRDRDMIQLVCLEGLSPEDAGRQMGLKKWAAYKAFRRAIERLRDMIEQHGNVLKKART